jgi:ribonuclease P protein component
LKTSLTSTEVSSVFTKGGQPFFCHPIKLLVGRDMVADTRTAVVVPKRLVKSAVRRNRLKRQMRAAIQKHEDVLRETSVAAACVFMYCGREKEQPFLAIENAIGQTLKMLANSHS